LSKAFSPAIINLREVHRLAAIAVFAVGLPAASRDVFDFVQKSCAGCHNPKLRSGDIDLASLTTPATFDDNREIWEKAVEKIRTGQMPPPGTPRPAEAPAVAKWLEGEFARLDRAIKPDPGRVTARRLNRAEYDNTIRDLLGIDIKPADNFPADSAAFGFDNIGDALGLSPSLLENYIDSAERVVRTALFGPAKLKPAAIHYSSPVRINDSRGTRRMPTNPNDYDLSGLSTLHSMHVVHRFPVDGEYNFRLVLNGHRPNQSEPAHPSFWIDGRMVKEFEVDATDLEGQIVEVRTRVTAGEHLLSASYNRTYHGLPPSYGGPEPSKRDPAALINPRGKLSEKDIETLRKYGTRIKTDGVETRIDNRYESIDVGGPFDQAAGPSPEALRRVFVCGHARGRHAEACARTIVRNFAGRAFRRPASAAEVHKFLAVAAVARKRGASFEEGIAAALQGILVAPAFLYRIERRVGPYELASRLSYFLWSSMPDAELLRLAGQGALKQPATLAAQVRRMLRDPKSRALVENFAGQWLQFKNIDVVRPDLERFPQFDDGLRLAMRGETVHFIDHIMRQDRSVLELLDADYTFLNERLARYYDIPGVVGPEFRKVAMVGPESRGGGLLSHAAILTVSSYSTRTSPVLRGKWILENLLNAPPPAPPPSVPALDDTKAGESATLRQQMEQHRKNPACASCHTRMDALGFGLENFDAIGGWRTRDGKLPVDSSGELPGGRVFKGPAELKALLKEDRAAFERGLAEKLLTYALGRGLERYDRPAVSAITTRLAARDHRFSELVLGVVESLPFQNSRLPQP
jgi:mono/diheme cytochrome c family protein